MKEDSPELKRCKELIMKLTVEERLFLLEKICELSDKENTDDSI